MVLLNNKTYKCLIWPLLFLRLICCDNDHLFLTRQLEALVGLCSQRSKLVAFAVFATLGRKPDVRQIRPNTKSDATGSLAW